MDIEETKQRKWFTSVTISMFLIGAVVGFGVNEVFFNDSNDNLAVNDGDNVEVVDSTDILDEILGDTSDQTATIDNTLDDLEKVTTGVIATGDNVLIVSNQPSGNEVIVSMISLEMNGWITIRDDSGDGESGNILGARRFDVGKYFGEKIELLRNTEVGKKYFVVLHSDDGIEGFDFKTEIPVKDTSGKMIMAEFIATGGVE